MKFEFEYYELDCDGWIELVSFTVNVTIFWYELPSHDSPGDGELEFYIEDLEVINSDDEIREEIEEHQVEFPDFKRPDKEALIDFISESIEDKLFDMCMEYDNE